MGPGRRRHRRSPDNCRQRCGEVNQVVGLVAKRAQICSDLHVSDTLPDDLETLKAILLAERCESERLRQIIQEMQRLRFDRKAETLPEEQMLLGLEDVEQVAATATVPTCRRICPGLRSSSISRTKPASAAEASCPGSARTEASG